MSHEKARIAPPLYLLEGDHKCDKCRENIKVIALLAPKVLNYEHAVNSRIAILSDMTEIPEIVLSFIQEKNSFFRLRKARHAEWKVYANSCPFCDEMADDFYLQSEPDGPFYAAEKEIASALKIAEIPLNGEIKIDGGLGFGFGDLILKYAQKM